MTTVPTTADSEQYWRAESSTEKTLRTLRHRVTAAVVIGLVFFVVATSVFFVKIDAKFSATQQNSADTKATVEKIRSTQVANITRNDAIATCEVGDFNDAFKALSLALSHDNNRADYPTAQICTAAAAPTRTRK